MDIATNLETIPVCQRDTAGHTREGTIKRYRLQSLSAIDQSLSVLGSALNDLAELFAKTDNFTHNFAHLRAISQPGMASTISI